MIKEWRGSFCHEYIKRNQSDKGRMEMWSKILNSIKPKSILEVGANIGLNLDIINNLIDADLIGLEPNDKARKQIAFNTLKGTADKIPLEDNAVELAFTCGVLIHIPPDDLEKACNEIYRVSSRYIVCIEYFSDKLVEIPYQGYNDMLWKQDFGKFWMNYGLSLIDYGFFWKPATGLDNLTFWIFEKNR